VLVSERERNLVDVPIQRLSYWQQHGGAATPLPSNEPPAQADIVVIGGGLAGLSTAIAILQRQPGARVVVLEAQFVGFGASGRNGGLLSPLPAPVWLLSAKANADHAWALRALNAKVHALGAWLGKTLPDSEVTACTLQLQAMGRLTTSGVSKVAEVLQHARIGYSLGPDAQRGGKRRPLASCPPSPFIPIGWYARSPPTPSSWAPASASTQSCRPSRPRPAEP